METLEKNESKDDVFIRVKVKKSPKATVLNEPLDKVTMVAVELSETLTEAEEVMDLNIHLQTRKLKVLDAVIKK